VLLVQWGFLTRRRSPAAEETPRPQQSAGSSLLLALLPRSFWHPSTPRRAIVATTPGRGGAYIGPRYLQAFGYAGSNTAARVPANPLARNPAARRRLFDATASVLLEAGAGSIERGGSDGGAGQEDLLPSPDVLAMAALKRAAGPLGAAAAGAKGAGGGMAPAVAPAGAQEMGLWAGPEAADPFGVDAAAAVLGAVAEAVGLAEEEGPEVVAAAMEVVLEEMLAEGGAE
jgi:hypothetical protein